MKRVFLLFIFIILLSGCVKSHNTMTINKDGSVSLESEILISDKLKELNDSILSSDDFKNFDVKLEEVSKNGYSGYKFSKEFNNIDDISKNHNEEVKLDKLYESGSKNNNLFSMTKGFFKNTYSAKYTYNKNDYNDYEDTSLEEETVLEEENIDETDMSELNDIANLATESELTFTVNLPYASHDNNATSKSNGNKTLTWNLITHDNEEIYFKFSIYNIGNIILVCIISLVLVIILISLIIFIKNKKTSESTLIYKEYDPSIESKIHEGKDVIIDRSKPERKLEYTLPEEDTKKHIKIAPKKPHFYDSSKYIDEELDFSDNKVKIDTPDAEDVRKTNKPQ